MVRPAYATFPAESSAVLCDGSQSSECSSLFVGDGAALGHVMFQAALVAANHNPTQRGFADRLRKASMPHKVIITAVGRKLATIANMLCKNRRKWAAPDT